MNIGAIPNQTFPCIGYAMSATRTGRMSLPVAPGLVIYSQLRHISGTPAPDGTQGVNISKLRILDTLIEQLSKIKNKPAAENFVASSDFGNLEGTEEQRINALIEQYQKQIKTAQSVSIYTPAAPAVGALFSIAI
jgi:hypothetical protein